MSGKWYFYHFTLDKTMTQRQIHSPRLHYFQPKETQEQNSVFDHAHSLTPGAFWLNYPASCTNSKGD